MNQLIHETSPYLLQHAHNPVHWYAWGNEAFERAKAEGKPVLVSIGYSACHWCHVMERESFEDATVAAYMNEHFINIKVDREERPDVDHLYMDAVQAMTGSGGWPLNVFTLPDGKPFYGGTYFPPRRAFNRASWLEVLESVHKAYTERKHVMDAQAENLVAYLNNANAIGTKPATKEPSWDKADMQKIADAILQQADTTWGGFGKAPKFPQTYTIQYLLRHHHYTKHEPSLQQALLSLDKMMQGGIYDQVGGGFARYSTDTEWLAPHFEKMLYDNALLLGVLAEAYQVTQADRYKRCMVQTVDFLERELLASNHVFNSALDADSEGVEGKFYTWQYSEIEAVLGTDAAQYAAMFDITTAGNWEHTNIPWLQQSLEQWATEKNLAVNELYAWVDACHEKLLTARAKRIRPLTDDKQLLSWNALMVTALCKVYMALGEPKYLQLAEQVMHGMEAAFTVRDSKHWWHTHKNGIAKIDAFLDDYAYLIQAYLYLQEATGKNNYLENVKVLIYLVVENFSDEQQKFFYFSRPQPDLAVRKKEVYDGATPSGNAIMAWNLYRAGTLLDNAEWVERSEAMQQHLYYTILRYPTSFGAWAQLLQLILAGQIEIVLLGNLSKLYLERLLARYIPNRLVQTGDTNETSLYPLLSQKIISPSNECTMYVCRQQTCSAPLYELAELYQIIQA